jgi:hypothetical protein
MISYHTVDIISRLVGPRGWMEHHKADSYIRWPNEIVRSWIRLLYTLYGFEDRGLVDFIDKRIILLYSRVHWVTNEKDFLLYSIYLVLVFLRRLNLYAGQRRWAKWPRRLEGWPNTAPAWLAGGEWPSMMWFCTWWTVHVACPDRQHHLPQSWNDLIYC